MRIMRIQARDRFWSKVLKTPYCWIWEGARYNTGYGRFSVNNSDMASHRFSYAEMVGPIPEGLVLDHLCRVRECVNPAHLEVVTNGENVLRGIGITAINAKKKICIRGHLLSPKNTRRFVAKGTGRKVRSCRKCDVIRQMAYRRRKEANK